MALWLARHPRLVAAPPPRGAAPRALLHTSAGLQADELGEEPPPIHHRHRAVAKVLAVEGGQGVEAGIAQLQGALPRRREHLGRGGRAQVGARLLPDKWAQRVIVASQKRVDLALRVVSVPRVAE